MKQKIERRKPEPYKWSILAGGAVVEHYDFQYWKRSNPPAKADDSVVLPFSACQA